MTDLTEWIKERRRIHKATLEGSWYQDRIHHTPEGREPHWCWEVNDRDGYPIVTELREDEDDAEEIATFIVDAHNTLPALLTAVEKVLELHEPISGFVGDPSHWECNVCGDERGPKPYPCPTVRAIEGAINE